MWLCFLLKLLLYRLRELCGPLTAGCLSTVWGSVRNSANQAGCSLVQRNCGGCCWCIFLFLHCFANAYPWRWRFWTFLSVYRRWSRLPHLCGIFLHSLCPRRNESLQTTQLRSSTSSSCLALSPSFFFSASVVFISQPLQLYVLQVADLKIGL